MTLRSMLEMTLARRPRLYLDLMDCGFRRDAQKVIFLTLVRDGDVVFDVGANRGRWTVFLSHIVGRSGRVHAFEPVPQTFQRLRATVRAQTRFDNVCLEPRGANCQSGTAMMHIPAEDDGQASLVVHATGSWASANRQTVHCQMCRLDDYAASLTRLDFVKLDLEGAELLALKGFRATLARLKPTMCLEVFREWTRDFGYAPSAIPKFLRELGYEHFCCSADGRIENIAAEDVGGELDRLTTSADLICATESSAATIQLLRQRIRRFSPGRRGWSP